MNFSNDFKKIEIIDEYENINSFKSYLQRYNPHILLAMKKEEYKIDFDDFDKIIEIKNDKEVIGIVSLIKIYDSEEILCINDVYLIPSYRKKGIFYNLLIKLLSQSSFKISFRNPNKTIIDLLITFNLAKKIKNNIVVSYIDFYVDYNNSYKNKQIEHYYEKYEKENQDKLMDTIFYDLNINSCIFFDIENLVKFNETPAFIEIARSTDSNQYDYFQKLKNVDLAYLKVLLEKLFFMNENLISLLGDSVKEEYLFMMIFKHFLNESVNVNLNELSEYLNNLILNILEENAVLYEDYYNYRDVLLFRMDEINIGQTDDYLQLFVQLFIIDINYWLKSNEHRRKSKPLSTEIFELYPDIIAKFKDRDIKEIFHKAYNSIKISSLKANDKLTLFYLYKSLVYEDIDDINREIEHYFFDEYLLKNLLKR